MRWCGYKLHRLRTAQIKPTSEILTVSNMVARTMLSRLFISTKRSCLQNKQAIQCKHFHCHKRLYSEDHHSTYNHPRLSRQQVSAILQSEEKSIEVNHEAVLKFDNCRLAANNPIEDRHAEGYCRATDGYLFGVFDGHGGVANAQAVSERLFNYIAVNLLNPHLLESFCERMMDRHEQINLVDFLTHSTTYFNKEFSGLYRESIVRYANETLSAMDDWEELFTMERALQTAFDRLDKDFDTEAFPSQLSLRRINSQLMTIALSDGPHLHIANAGDCGAVLGTLSDDGSWEAKALSTPHHADCKEEQARIYKQHPNEKGTVIKDGRLLGALAPTRAFGDFRFKLPAAKLRETGELIRSMSFSDEEVGMLPVQYYEPAQYYYTPPYVTARPEVTYHHLRPKDKFLVLASDGLWDMFPNNNSKVVQLVADHMIGAQTNSDFYIPKDRKIPLGELNELLKIRKSNISKRAEDNNCATHLIRNAIGQTEVGISHSKLSAMLTLPDNFVRYYRDDITVTVVYFDEAYLTDSLSAVVPD